MRSLLYSVETNVERPPRALPVDRALKVAANAFGIVPQGGAHEVDKLSKELQLFVVSAPDGQRFVLRRSAPATQSAVEAQCQLFALLPPGTALMPLRCGDDFTVLADAWVWMAYPFLAGSPFDGGLDALDDAVGSAFALIDHLQSAGRRLDAAYVRELPKVTLRPDAWQPAVDALMDDSRAALSAALGADLRDALQGRRKRLEDMVSALKSVSLGPLAPTHYDLQHANMLMTPMGVRVIDIEDVVIAPPLLTACHALFKLARHQVFRDRASRDEVVARVIPRHLDALGIEGGARRFFMVSELRTIDDIAGILRRVDDGFDYVLYDLRKKALNLLEAADLSGCGAVLDV